MSMVEVNGFTSVGNFTQALHMIKVKSAEASFYYLTQKALLSLPRLEREVLYDDAMPSLRQPFTVSDELGDGSLYFAYGSNMHLQQIAKRCPDCTLYATGILQKYRWQINSRGGANVVEGNQEDFVEGIIFTLSSSDIRALRGYEGVTQHFYAEERLEIEVEHRLGMELEGRKPAEAAEILAKYNSNSSLNEVGLTKTIPWANAVIPEQRDTQCNSVARTSQLQIVRERPITNSRTADIPQKLSRSDTPSENKAINSGVSIPKQI